MDARDYLDDDGWPAIADRDKLPLVWLIQGAALTTGFVKRESALPQYKSTYQLRCELRAERDAVCYELTLPAWWHYAPTRQHKCPDRRGKPKVPP